MVDYSPDFLSNGKGYEALHFLPEPTMQKTSPLKAEMTHHELPSRDAIKVDTPFRLSEAAAIAFQDGTMTASGLRRENARGRLVIERIAFLDGSMSASGLRRESGAFLSSARPSWHDDRRCQILASHLAFCRGLRRRSIAGFRVKGSQHG